jgi:hypothetical protein
MRSVAPKQSAQRFALGLGVSGQAYGLLYPETPRRVYMAVAGEGQRGNQEASVKQTNGLPQTP